MTRVVFKVGSSLVTEDRNLSLAKIDALAEQIARLAAAGGSPVVVTSGAIAAGSGRLKLPRRPRTIPEKQAAAAVGQSYLMAAWEHAFRAPRPAGRAGAPHRRRPGRPAALHERGRTRSRRCSSTASSP